MDVNQRGPFSSQTLFLAEVEALKISVTRWSAMDIAYDLEVKWRGHLVSIPMNPLMTCEEYFT